MEWPLQNLDLKKRTDNSIRASKKSPDRFSHEHQDGGSDDRQGKQKTITKKELFLEAGRAVTGLNSEDIPVMGSCLVK